MSTEITYDIDRNRCQQMIGDRVCSGCGGKLEPLETVNNSDRPTFWAACIKCSSFDWGIPESIFAIAQELVLHHHYVHYSHLGGGYEKVGEERRRWEQSQIRGTSSLVQTILQISQKHTSTKQTMYRILPYTQYKTQAPHVEAVYNPVNTVFISPDEHLQKQMQAQKPREWIIVMFKDGSREDFKADTIEQCLSLAETFINSNQSGSIKTVTL